MQGYPASKTLAEKAAWKFAQENNIDLITVIPSLMTGPSLTPDVPSSIGLATSLLSGIKLEPRVLALFLDVKLMHKEVAWSTMNCN